MCFQQPKNDFKQTTIEVHFFWEDHKNMTKSPNIFFDTTTEWFQIKFGNFVNWILVVFSEYMNFKIKYSKEKVITFHLQVDSWSIGFAVVFDGFDGF